MANAEHGLVELENFFQREIAQKDLLTRLIDEGTFEKFTSSSPIWALARFIGGESQQDPIGLFWKLYKFDDGSHSHDPVATSSEDWDEVLLVTLKRLYERHKVPYDPDGDSWSETVPPGFVGSSQPTIPEKIRNLTTFLHVAAARAFTIKRIQGGGIDEEALECLREVPRTLDRLYTNGLSDLIDQNSSQSFQLSADAVAAKAFVELGRVSCREGRYADALHHFTLAAFNASYAAERYIAEGGDSLQPVGSEKVPMEPSCDIASCILEDGLDTTSAGEITSIFMRLKAHGQASDWAQVAQDCNTLLVESDYAFGAQLDSYVRAVGDETEYITEWVLVEPDLVRDEKGETLSWREFWHAAKAWASAQLSPNEYKKLREEDEKSASQRRLKCYFFVNCWDELPQRAKDRLVVADTIWNAPERMAWEAVLSELRIAAEDLFDKYVFQPLNDKGVDINLELLGIMNEAKASTEHSQLFFFSKMCRCRGFENLLNRWKVKQGDVKWLTAELPTMFDRLRQARNSAEHGDGDSWYREDVRPFFHAFLGVGQQGVLPELARVGRILKKG